MVEVAQAEAARQVGFKVNKGGYSMLNWLKFFPFQCRIDHNPEKINGPYFSKYWKNKWKFGDNRFYFYAPLSNPVFAFFGDARGVDKVNPQRRDILNSEWKQAHGRERKGPFTGWHREIFYSNLWYFVGPWFTGSQANLSLDALLVTAQENHKLYGKSLLHPRIFESAVANYLDDSYGYETNGSGKKPHYRGPLNWHLLGLTSSIKAITCDVHEVGNGSKENPLLHRLIFFPVAENRFVRLNFNFGGTEIYRDEVRAKPLFELCDSIISSFRLEVGQQTLAEWEKVKASCPDMSLTETMMEFPWPLKYEKPSKKRLEVDITSTKSSLDQQTNNRLNTDM